MAEAGRDPDAFDVTAYAAKVDLIDSLEEAGVNRTVFTLPPAAPEVVIPRLDKLASAIF